MNANETIFALALASNDRPREHFTAAYQALGALGEAKFSPVYQIPCRDGIGADYWNGACLLKTDQSRDGIEQTLKHLEFAAGRRRPSHQITLDIDLIAWGQSLDCMQFNLKKMPLALDVKIPLSALWPHPDLYVRKNYFEQINFNLNALV